MRRWLQGLMLFGRRAPIAGRPEWTKADAVALAGFLGSGTGRRLRGTMLSEIAAANERAAMSAGSARVDRTAFECGWACGYRGLYAWFEALSAQAAADERSQNEPEDPFGEDAGLEHLNP